MIAAEHDAGEGQVLVVYVTDDYGNELDPVAIHAEIAADAARRAAAGLRIVAMSSTDLRHAQGFMAREGSGYETKAAIAVTYAPAPRT